MIKAESRRPAFVPLQCAGRGARSGTMWVVTEGAASGAGVGAGAFSGLPSRLQYAVGNLVGGVEGFTPTGQGERLGAVVGMVAGGAGVWLFVKAVPAGHPAAGDYRVEARVGAVLPAGVPTPKLRLVEEADGWVLLGFDPVIGRTPAEPWTGAELAAALDALAVTAPLLSPAPPVRVPTVAQRMAGRCQTWRALLTHGHHGPVERTGLGSFEHAHLARLADLEKRWATAAGGDTLVHFDLRHDNWLLTGDGQIMVVDWGRACLGAPWVDLVCLLLESDLGPHDPQQLFTGHPLARGVDEQAVDGLLTALASYWTHAAALPVGGTPWIRARQERSRQATLRWLSHRWS